MHLETTPDKSIAAVISSNFGETGLNLGWFWSILLDAAFESSLEQLLTVTGLSSTWAPTALTD